ncbi:hypothetical protein BN2476_930018 [Paraburkholderia piptadeniae]|uniref:Uncharacterized protein n=1 Tax=Paraburkholderia piptadeniae TaxID=1701573 RepID=A0A1N7STM0_9BURK|nr:hypothetical protein BN2476_930018 [Paraburkholderia piptadeniae]
MSPSFTRWLTPSRASRANLAARFRNPGSFKATEVTITTNTAVHYTLPASTLKSPDEANLTAADWAKPAGSSSAPSPGFTTSDGCASASNVLHSSTKPS